MPTLDPVVIQHEMHPGGSSLPDKDVLRLYFPPRQLNADELFESEKAAFMLLLPSLYLSHRGKFVAVHKGKVAAAGASEVEAARNFFREYGDTHVYIGFVGQEPPAYQIRPRR